MNKSNILDIINCNDIQNIINEFLVNLMDILPWKYTCKQNADRRYFVMMPVNYKQTKYHNIFKQSHDIPYIHNMFNIISITTPLPYYFNDTYMIHFRYLTYLDCSHRNNITDNSLIYLTRLLHLKCNNVISDRSISQLTNLLSLDIRDNTLISDKSLVHLTQLRHLIIGNKTHSTSEASVSQLVSWGLLLNLHSGFDNNITNLSIMKLTKLTKLYLYGNQQIDNIPSSLRSLHASQLLTNESISNLINLTHLCCRNNINFTDISLYKFNKLQILKCGNNNNFTDYALQQLINLTYLDCGYNNNFTNYGLQSLINLKELYCVGNSNFTDRGLKHLKLTFLHCGSNNNFTTNGILQLSLLKELVCPYGRNNIEMFRLKPLLYLKKVNGNIFVR